MTQQHLLYIFTFLLSTCTLLAQAFHKNRPSLQFKFRQQSSQDRRLSKLILSIANDDNGQDIVPQSSSDEDEVFHKELKQRHDEIIIEKTRLALEEQHTKSFLKKRPVKLPYKQARKWVQANLGVNTKEEYEDFVAMGYINTPYIPKNPEEYYTRTRDWINWEHFLTGDDNDSSTIHPLRGVFD